MMSENGNSIGKRSAGMRTAKKTNFWRDDGGHELLVGLERSKMLGIRRNEGAGRNAR